MSVRKSYADAFADAPLPEHSERYPWIHVDGPEGVLRAPATDLDVVGSLAHTLVARYRVEPTEIQHGEDMLVLKNLTCNVIARRRRYLVEQRKGKSVVQIAALAGGSPPDYQRALDMGLETGGTVRQHVQLLVLLPADPGNPEGLIVALTAKGITGGKLWTLERAIYDRCAAPMRPDHVPTSAFSVRIGFGAVERIGAYDTEIHPPIVDGPSRRLTGEEAEVLLRVPPARIRECYDLGVAWVAQWSQDQATRAPAGRTAEARTPSTRAAAPAPDDGEIPF